MSSEYNRTAHENSLPTEEFAAVSDNKPFAGNAAPRESNDYAEGNGAAPAQRKKRSSSNRSARLLSALLAAAAAVAVTASVVITPAPQVTVSASASDTTVDYFVTTDGEGLSVVLTNDLTRREFPLKQGENNGVFADLKPGLQYTVAVVSEQFYGERVLAQTTVRTLTQPPPPVHVPVSEFRSLTSKCMCGIDGYFHFTMDFIDEKGCYSDFAASLTDAFGNTSQCVFSDDLHAEQRIDVALSGNLLGSTATFVLTCTYTDDDGNVSTLTLCDQTVKI